MPSMSILTNQFNNILEYVPELINIEKQANLPTGLLFAIGSKETNLTIENSPSGNGIGMFQIDKRWHQVPNTIYGQAQLACQILNEGYSIARSWLGACNYYNSGQISSAGTTGGNYGNDVMDMLPFFASLVNNYLSTPRSPQSMANIYTNFSDLPTLTYNVNVSYGTVKTYQILMNAKHGANLKVDGYYGDLTQAQTQKVFGTNDVTPNEWQILFNTATPSATQPTQTMAPAQPVESTTNLENLPTLQTGSTGVMVEAVQLLLNGKSGDTLAIDGIFGNLTETAVKNFQAKVNLSPSGIIDDNTWTQLINYNG